MRIVTKIFDEIEIDEAKIIRFPGGIIGFPELTDFTLVHDEEKGMGAIHWLQSLQEPAFAIPVMDPLLVCPDYNPVIDDELLTAIGPLKEEGVLVLVTVTIPREITGMSVNLKGPVVINADLRMACQIILEEKEYLIKYPIYDLLNQKKEGV